MNLDMNTEPSMLISEIRGHFGFRDIDFRLNTRSNLFGLLAIKPHVIQVPLPPHAEIPTEKLANFAMTEISIAVMDVHQPVHWKRTTFVLEALRRKAQMFACVMRDIVRNVWRYRV